MFVCVCGVVLQGKSALVSFLKKWFLCSNSFIVPTQAIKLNRDTNSLIRSWCLPASEAASKVQGVWIFPPPQIVSQTLAIVLIFVSCDVSVKVKSDRKVNWCLQGRVLPVRWHCQWRPPDSHVLEQLTQALLHPYTPSHHHGGQGQQPRFYFLARHVFDQIIFCRNGVEFWAIFLSFSVLDYVPKVKTFLKTNSKNYRVKILLQSSLSHITALICLSKKDLCSFGNMRV